MNLKYYFAKFIEKIQVAAIKDCVLDKTARVYERSNLSKVSIGRYSYITKNCTITDVHIGAFCSIGSFCQIGGGIHLMDTVSTSPVFLNGKNPLRFNFSHIEYSPSELVTIGNDVWIGTGAYIKAGVSIGDGSVIGAHSVVTHDVEPYSIVAGVPARTIRKRFDEDTIQKLLALKWWSWPDEKLQKYGQYFSSPEELLARIEQDR